VGCGTSCGGTVYGKGDCCGGAVYGNGGTVIESAPAQVNPTPATESLEAPAEPGQSARNWLFRNVPALRPVSY
jgi:hypothetical protein